MLIALAGLGIAAYHPEGARYATYLAGDRRATGMSWFSVGGNLGFALGPAMLAAANLWLGLSGTLLVASLPLAAALLLQRELRHLRRFRPSRPRARGTARATRPTSGRHSPA